MECPAGSSDLVPLRSLEGVGLGGENSESCTFAGARHDPCNTVASDTVRRAVQSVPRR